MLATVKGFEDPELYGTGRYKKPRDDRAVCDYPRHLKTSSRYHWCLHGHAVSLVVKGAFNKRRMQNNWFRADTVLSRGLVLE
jgi:hypothetical protein